MGEEGTFYKAVFILGITFAAGFTAGYKVIISKSCNLITIDLILKIRQRSSGWSG